MPELNLEVDVTTLPNYDLVTPGSHTLELVAQGLPYRDSFPSTVINFNKLSTPGNESIQGVDYEFSEVTNTSLYRIYAVSTSTGTEYELGDYVPVTYDPILQNNTWEQIATAFNNGEAPLTWTLGSTKTDTISLSGTTYNCTYILVDTKQGRHTFTSNNSGTHCVFELAEALPVTMSWASSNQYPTYYDDSNIATYFSTFKTNLSNSLQAQIKEVTLSSGETAELFPTSFFEVCTGSHGSPEITPEDETETNGYGELEYHADGYAPTTKTVLGSQTTAQYWLRSFDQCEFYRLRGPIPEPGGEPGAFACVSDACGLTDMSYYMGYNVTSALNVSFCFAL